MRRKLLVELLAFAGLATVAIGLWGWVPTTVKPSGRQLARNAAWIGVEWTSAPAASVAVQRLTADAAAHRLRYLYPYTTYVKPDGSLNPTYDYAASFMRAFRASNQETRLLAWIGVPLRNERPIGMRGWVDLGDEAARQHIVTWAAEMVRKVGFDGIHVDAEPVSDGDADYLRLLEEIRAAIGDEAILSVAGAYWLPAGINSLPLLRRYKWSPSYYRQVGSRVDQIAAMTYDSLAPHPALYRLWMREQARAMDRALAGSSTELLIGVSASRERTLTHHPCAENVVNGLAGLSAYLAEGSDSIVGVALYAAWEAEPSDWQAWDCATSH